MTGPTHLLHQENPDSCSGATAAHNPAVLPTPWQAPLTLPSPEIEEDIFHLVGELKHVVLQALEGARGFRVAR